MPIFKRKPNVVDAPSDGDYTSYVDKLNKGEVKWNDNSGNAAPISAAEPGTDRAQAPRPQNKLPSKKTNLPQKLGFLGFLAGMFVFAAGGFYGDDFIVLTGFGICLLSMAAAALLKGGR